MDSAEDYSNSDDDGQADNSSNERQIHRRRPFDEDGTDGAQLQLQQQDSRPEGGSDTGLNIGLAVLCCVVVVLIYVLYRQHTPHTPRLYDNQQQTVVALVRYVGFGTDPFRTPSTFLNAFEQEALAAKDTVKSAVVKKIYEMAKCAERNDQCTTAEHVHLVTIFQRLGLLAPFTHSFDKFLESEGSVYKDVSEPYNILAGLYNSMVHSKIPSTLKDIVVPGRPSDVIKALVVLVGDPMFKLDSNLIHVDMTLDKFRQSQLFRKVKRSVLSLQSIIKSHITAASTYSSLFIPQRLTYEQLKSKKLRKRAVADQRLFQSLSHIYFHNQDIFEGALMHHVNDALSAALRVKPVLFSGSSGLLTTLLFENE